MTEIPAPLLIARALKQQGVETAFGVVGIPVEPVALAMQQEGISFVNTRHEQAAAYAAQCLGYLTRKPGVCLTVPGPGATNAVSGLANAQANRWPMLLIAGGAELSQRGMGGFEEMPQIEAMRPYTKWAMLADDVRRLPWLIEEAMRVAASGVPGPVYLELPGDLIDQSAAEDLLPQTHRVASQAGVPASPEGIAQTLAALRSAQRPLVIFGKGAAYARAEQELRRFIELTGLPWLSSPMGKGLIPDDDPLSVAACRSYALQNADLILLIGARLNWIMHFGRPPRFAADLRLIQIEIDPDEIGHNLPAEVALVGDARTILGQLNHAIEAESPGSGSRITDHGSRPYDWMQSLEAEKHKNVERTEPLLASNELPMNYYRMLREIRDVLPRDAYVIAEGAATMDISRQVLNTYEPRHRIDAGTLGTMGVGPGYAIATQIADPGARVLALEGDSAFGFSGMEIEVAVRYRLPIIWVVVNNNGYGGGPEELDYAKPLPPNAFVPGIRYDRMMEAFGGLGFHAETPEQLHTALEDAVASGRTALINVKINPQARRRPQQFGWLTR